NSGFEEDARALARTMLDAFDGADAVVSPSGSCTAMIRSYYPHLFHGRSEQARAEALAGRTYELTEYVVDVAVLERVEGRWVGVARGSDRCTSRRSSPTRPDWCPGGRSPATGSSRRLCRCVGP